MHTKRLFVSRDVKFYEHIFPFSKQNVDVSPFFNEHLRVDDMFHEPYTPSPNCQLPDTNNNDDSLSKIDKVAPDLQSQDKYDLVSQSPDPRQEEEVSLPQETTYVLRRSGRATRPSVWHKYYQINNSNDEHTILNVVVYHNFFLSRFSVF